MAIFYKEGSFVDPKEEPLMSTLIELYWDDLTEKTQNEIRNILGLYSDREYYWKCMPLAVMEIKGEEELEGSDPH